MNSWLVIALVVAAVPVGVLVLWRIKKYFWDGLPKNWLQKQSRRLFWLVILPTVIVGLILVRQGVIAIPNIAGRDVHLKGNTPLEKAQSLVEFLNRNSEYKTLGRISLVEIDYINSTWHYMAMMNYTSEGVFDDQGLQSKYVSMMGDIIVKTSEFDFVKEIRLVSVFLDLKADSVTVNEEGLKNIRNSPRAWVRYTDQKFFDLVFVE
ncbi:MAG: hypothetical protein AAB037_04245 [Chloroflexota bacterium]